MEAAGPRIILVEDNPADVNILHHALDELGRPYVLEVLPDGETALDYLQSHCRQYDPEPCAIVLDLDLQRIDGIEVLRQIKANGIDNQVSVVVLTCGVSAKERQELFDIGVSLFRLKPSRWDDMVLLAQDLFELCDVRGSNVVADALLVGD